MTAAEKIPWKFLSDEAVEQSESDCFGVHSAYARLLLGMSETAVTPFSIALYGNWGTGKTSVAKILQSLAEKASDIFVVYLDVWKYSSDPLKRWILLETERQLTGRKVIEAYKFQGRTLQSHLEFEEHAEDETKIAVDRNVIAVLVAMVVVAAISVVLVSLYAPDNWKSNGVLGGLIVVLSGIGFASLLLTAVFGELLKSISGMVFRRTVRQTVVKPAFSSEKFGEIFGDLVKQATKKDGRLLFIFDNLDRCSEQVAVETIGVVKTYLDERNCIYLIPCDEDALVKHISRSYISQTESDQEGYAREFLNKFFQVTVRLPASSDFDIEKFLDRQLEAAKMSDLPVGAREVLVLGYMGQTPRQVKRVINDLIAFRALAVEAESRSLVPERSLTGDLALLTKMCVISTQWPSILTRLGDDPELWSEMAEEEFGPATEAEQGLREFLRATRHVSPSSDVRPFIFLKQFDFERDPSVSRAVEECLRKGDWASYQGLLSRELAPSRKTLVLEKTLTTVRQWLQAKRQIFVQNAAPLVLKAALLIPDDWDLELLALSVLESLAEKLSANDFEKVVDVQDALQLDPVVSTTQKRRVLAKLTELFTYEFETTPARERSLRAVLERSDQFSQSQKENMAQAVNRRYGGKDRNEEEAMLRVLSVAESKPLEFAWLLQQELLERIVVNVDFSDTPLDAARIKLMASCKTLLARESKRRFIAALGGWLSIAKHPTLDADAQRGIDALLLFGPEDFQPEDLTDLAAILIQQATRVALNLRGGWLKPLLHLYSVLPPTQRDSLETLLAKDIENPADPKALVALLQSLNATERRQLLSVDRLRAAFRSQPRNLERFGATNATAHRKQVIECFEALDLIATPEIFAESTEWDLLIFIGVIQKAAADEGDDPKRARARLVEFCKSFLVGQLPKAMAVYDGVCSAVDAEPKLISSELADVLCVPTLELFESELEHYYSWFKFWKAKLDPPRRTELVRAASERFLHQRGADWIAILQLISADVVNDEELRKDQSLVKELFDYAFVASEEDPVAGAKPLLELLPYLGDQHLRDYIDRALDTMITYEASKRGLDRMEPFLKMVEAPGARLTGDDIDKAVRFCRRMLGAANTMDEQNRILKSLTAIKRPELVTSLRGELEQLTNSESAEIAESARSLLQQAAADPEARP